MGTEFQPLRAVVWRAGPQPGIYELVIFVHDRSVRGWPRIEGSMVQKVCRRCAKACWSDGKRSLQRTWASRST